nr:hypothetical protein [Neisseria subflava]
MVAIIYKPIPINPAIRVPVVLVWISLVFGQVIPGTMCLYGLLGGGNGGGIARLVSLPALFGHRIPVALLLIPHQFHIS